jgi:hypothetical protein
VIRIVFLGGFSMKYENSKKIFVLGIMSLLLIINFTSSTINAIKISTIKQGSIKHIYIEEKFGGPIIKECNSQTHIEINSINLYSKDINKPVLPIYKKIITLPLGSKILDIKCKHSQPKNIKLSSKIEIYGGEKWIETGEEVYEESKFSEYPKTWYSYSLGGGIKDGKLVTFLIIEIYPARYIAKNNVLEYIEEIRLDITYREAKNQTVNNKGSLLIICPSLFKTALQKLVDHKNSMGIKTSVVTLDEIYSKYEGYDEAEKIKYAIRDEIEVNGIRYVLLVGSIDKLPIRKTWFIQKWHDQYWNITLLSDLYYADIYDANGSFCSWDSNRNGKYGEKFYGVSGLNDTVDLYPDVYLGRLACKNVFEVKTVVNKIVTYEKQTYGKEWFKRLLLIGGDTFPGWGVTEGEFVTERTAQILSEFNPIKIWASLGNLNPVNIQKELNRGCGFVHYSGHGFEYGFATHPLNKEEWIGCYYTPYATMLVNGYKLPVMFFDACLTAKLDFNSSDLRRYGIPFPFDLTFPCFAWFLVKKPFGGAIATIGATRVAFTHVSSSGIHAGASRLAIDFFSAYHNTTILGEMFVDAQINYLEKVREDYYTLEEFILLGDPTLKVGGYPS